MFFKVQMECNFSQKAQSGIDWQVPAQFISAEIWPLGAWCGSRPVWTSHRPVWYSLFLLLLPEALQQDSLVGRVEHSCLLQVLLCDVTGKTIKDVKSQSRRLTAFSSVSLRASVPEELQVVPAVVQKTLLIPLQPQPLQPLPH